VHLNALLNLAVLYEDNNHYDEAHRCLDAVLAHQSQPPARASLYEGRGVGAVDVLRRRRSP